MSYAVYSGITWLSLQHWSNFATVF